jgi:hypothetical protein
MNKPAVLAILIATSAFTTVALADEREGGWVAGTGYTSFSESEYNVDISLSALWGSLGYQIKATDNFYLTPEVKIGMGIGSDTIMVDSTSVDVELDSYLAASLRGEYDFQNGAYLFVAPTYAKGDFNVNVGSDFAESSSWEFGAGIGAGYNFSPEKKVEVAYESFDGTDMISLAVKFDF